MNHISLENQKWNGLGDLEWPAQICLEIIWFALHSNPKELWTSQSASGHVEITEDWILECLFHSSKEYIKALICIWGSFSKNLTHSYLDLINQQERGEDGVMQIFSQSSISASQEPSNHRLFGMRVSFFHIIFPDLDLLPEIQIFNSSHSYNWHEHSRSEYHYVHSHINFFYGLICIIFWWILIERRKENWIISYSKDINTRSTIQGKKIADFNILTKNLNYLVETKWICFRDWNLKTIEASKTT